MNIPKYCIDKINQTIEYVSDICDNQKDCNDCPFYVQSDNNYSPACIFNDVPAEWLCMKER